jgi:Ser/Thr protein kinase RdoA (MazF antagonist)
VPSADLIRSTLLGSWHLVPSDVVAVPGGLMSCTWAVTAGGCPYVVRLAEPASRQAVEAGLAAAEWLRAQGVEAGDPVRALTGGLTAEAAEGVVAVLRRVPGRPLDGGDPVDQQWWGDRLGAAHGALQQFRHPGVRPWRWLDPDAPHLAAEPWLPAAVAAAVSAAVRLTVTDRLTYGLLHGDPAPEGFAVDPATGRAGVFDWGACGTGPLVYDLAAAVSYCGGPEAAGELLDGYVAAAPVGRDEVDAALPVLLRYRRAVEADWSLRHGRRDVLDRARAALESMSGQP